MKKYIIALGLLAPTVLFGQIDRSIRPEASPAPTININDSEVFTTKNGITVILSENHKLPRVSFNLVMGSNPELEGIMAGLSDIAGSLIMSGTSSRTKDQLDNQIDYIGASLSADKNSMYLSCLTKHMDKGLTLMSDVLQNANFPQSEVDRIISQNKSGLLATKSDAGTMSQNAVSVANFSKSHPYSEVMTEKSLSNINRDAIIQYYKRKFTPNGSYLVIVGDISKDKASVIADQYFGNWMGTKVFQEQWGAGKFTKGNRVLFVKKPGAVQSVIKVSFPINITPSHEDYLKLTVLNNILGGSMFGARLMQNLREDKAYTYGCYSRINITENGSWLAAGGNFRNEVTDSAVTQILYELERITDENVTKDELDLIRSAMAGGFARSLERPSTVARFALNIIKNKLPKNYYQTYLKNLEAITVDDLLLVAQKYFTSKNCNIVVVGNEDVIDNLKVFDTDGKIEMLDAFGKEVKETSIMPAKISADMLLAAYVNKVTNPSSKKKVKMKAKMPKKARKKIKKITSMKEVFELSMPQMPMPLISTKIWISPDTSVQFMEVNGMQMQKSYFDGTSGYTSNMQTGKEEYDADDINAEKKSKGLFPEMYYKSTGMNYELLGIEKVDGINHYVLKVMDGKSETYSYYNKETLLKSKSISIQTQDGETQEVVVTYDDFKEDNGIMLPTKTNISTGEVNLSGKLKTRTFNENIDLKSIK
ncbi:MAG: insulinase family protein [Crocinitomicaceae bacterium]|nr:insulinase family protein [Crocinitomicaceae bacterium]